MRFAGAYRFVMVGLAAMLVLPAFAWMDPLDAAAAKGASVRWHKYPDGRAFAEVAGLGEEVLLKLAASDRPITEWQRIFAVHSGKPGEADSGLPPVTGSYSVADRVLRFEPAFPVRPGVEYRAEFYPAAISTPVKINNLSARLFVPAPAEKRTTRVAAVYPSASVLPENLLKFYLHFSAPMSRGDTYRHIRLLDSSGRAVELPFLELDEELWDPEMTRLTLLLDPGRIKRGVLPLEEIGSSLVPGGNYVLLIDGDFRDAAGNRLRTPFRKEFRVKAADREPPDLALWKITAPKSGGRGTLRITFPEPLDHALAQRMIRVADADGAILDGNVRLDPGELHWRFVPGAKWRHGKHEILIAATLEDIAGNNPGKPFDVDVFENVEARITTDIIRVAFEVR